MSGTGPGAVLVTGGSRGIGAAICARLAADGLGGRGELCDAG